MSDVAAVEPEEDSGTLLNVTPDTGPPDDAASETNLPHLV